MTSEQAKEIIRLLTEIESGLGWILTAILLVAAIAAFRRLPGEKE